MAGDHGVHKIMGRKVGSQYLVLATWAVTFGAVYLATRKSDEKKLEKGPSIQTAGASDPEETKFIEQFLKDAEKEGRKPAHAGHH